MTSGQPEIQTLVEVVVKAAERFGGPTPPIHAVEEMIAGVLFREKDIWGCLTDGLITVTEARNRFLAEVDSWLRKKLSLGWREHVDWPSEDDEAKVDAALCQ